MTNRPGSNSTPLRSAEPSRRRLLGWVTGLGTGLRAAGLAGGFSSKALRRGTGVRKVVLARLDELPETGYLRVAIPLEVQRGWAKTTVSATVYARREGMGEVLAMSGQCTHMGCVVRWVDGEQQFHCPCHEGKYDAEGGVVSGPVPRPLARLATTVEDGEVHVELPEPR